MPKLRCSIYAYHKSRLDKLDSIANGIRQGIASNPVLFPAPPVTNTAFEALLLNYENSRSAFTNGGKAQRPAFLIAKANLIGALDNLAVYVDGIANGDETVIWTAGFTPIKGTRGIVQPPAQPQSVTLRHGDASGILLASCAKIAGALSYGCVLSEGLPLPHIRLDDAGKLFLGSNITWNVWTDLSWLRKKVFVNLIPGVIYYCYFFAGNTAGLSPLAVQVSRMAV